MAITAVYDATPCWALGNLVASSEEFQRIVGAADEAAALNNVHFLEAQDRREGDGPMPQPRPRAIIDWEERVLNRSGIDTPTDAGTLVLSFEFLSENLLLTGAESPPTFRELCIGFMNSYGTIIHEMFTNMGAAPHQRLQLRQLSLTGLPSFERQQDEEYWGVAFMVPFF